jgi:hypothetical protein
MKKSTFEISQELYELQQKIEEYLVQTEGEVDEQAEWLLIQFEQAKEQIDQKIYALRYVNKRLEEDKEVANGGLQYHKKRIDSYKNTIKARENAQERLKSLAKRLLAFVDGKCSVEGQTVYTRKVLSVGVDDLSKAIESCNEYILDGTVFLEMNINDYLLIVNLFKNMLQDYDNYFFNDLQQAQGLINSVQSITLDSKSKEVIKEMYKQGVQVNGFTIEEKESIINL